MVLTRLVWHEWRQGRVMMLCCVTGYLVLGTWLEIVQSDSVAWLGLLAVLATILGASVFAGDQRQGQYQFFTEHGVRPRLVWASRQLVWGFVFGTLAASVATLQLLHGPLAIHEINTIGSLVGFGLIAFTSSQLCSILIRSGIVAVFTAAICSVLLVLWVGLMQSLGVMFVFSVLPLPWIFLWASWLYAPKWIQQRHTWRARVVTAATIILPLSLVVAATAVYRVYEIPAITISFDSSVPKTYDSPAARETATMYQRADQLLRRRLGTNQSEDSLVISSRDDEWRAGIEMFIAATQRETCHFYHWYDHGTGSPFDGAQLRRAVLAEARVRIEEGDLEGAAELHKALLRLATHFYNQNFEPRYRSSGISVEQEVFADLPRWANHESLTPQRLERALADLQTWSAANHPDFEADVVEHRRRVHRLIALDDKIMDKYYGMGAPDRTAIKTLGRLLPWERWRMSRLLDLYTEAELQGIREIRARGIGLPSRVQNTLHWDVRLDLGNGKQRLIRSTDVDAWLSTTQWLKMTSVLTAPSYVLWEKQYQVRRNAVQLQLVLIAWRKEHGQLPNTLSTLLGERLSSLPTDPYTNQPFLYFPEGIEQEIWDDANPFGGMMMGAEGMGSAEANDEAAAQPRSRLVRTEPFLWSPGEQLHYAPGEYRNREQSPVANDFRFRTPQGTTLTEQDLLYYGQRYFIPTKQDQPPDSSDDTDALPNDE